MIKVGEMSGTLADSFDYLGKEYQQEENLRKKVTSALLYPLIIIFLMIGVGILMMTFVLPRLGKVFLKLNLDLPLATRFLLQVSLFMERNSFLVIIALALLAVLSLLIIKSRKGKAFFFFLGVRIPIVKKLLWEYGLIRFNQSLSSLMKVGVPIGESLEIASKALDPTTPERFSKIFGEKIAKGLPLSTVFTEIKVFPPLMIQMLAVGERAGNLEKVLSDLSGFYQQEVEDSLKDLITLLEPTLMILVGIAVGLMIIAFISPIYSLIGKLQPG
jgi:type IV pilus assembly protein PilC